MKKRIRKSIGILLVVVMLTALVPMTVMAYTDDEPAAGPATRAEAITRIWRAAGSPAQTGDSPFTDVAENASYHDAVLWAYGRRMTRDIAAAETFDPESPITLQELVVLLWRHINSPVVRARDWADFPNVEEIAPWALVAMEWALANNIIGSDGTLNPTDYITLAQAELVIGSAEQRRPQGGRHRAAPASVWRWTTVDCEEELLAVLKAGYYNVIEIVSAITITGELVIQSGTVLVVLKELTISEQGSLELNGVLENDGIILVESSGELTVNNGWLINNGIITVDGELTIEGSGWCDYNEWYNVGWLDNGGIIKVEDGGELTVNNGVLENYGTITVYGDLTIGGTGLGIVGLNSGSELTVEDGGKLTVDDNGSLYVDYGGELTLVSGGGIDVENGGSIGNLGTIYNYGSIFVREYGDAWGNKPLGSGSVIGPGTMGPDGHPWAP